ncbi:APC family permease [Desulfitobacterium metallireducens]|uniref:Amino acid permease n=1 Tax=Desulfitobacterium metallireducens DSM 15288 TaxID=871968 RepID=W0EFS8_9FIRM|nr:APC family permease [Desulfitobacterium metallireducens]AHF07931.1 amino acid permease [Desulfitobacterium metallireducens DSM 15288]
MLRYFKRFLIGKPMNTAQLMHQRLTKKKALAVFSSDALSSVAYATEEILLVLTLAGTVALPYSLPIAAAIIALLAILVLSYRQTIFAYPSGGGAYIVAKDNLGTTPGLVAGASLFIDYILTVAVSTAAGVAAITSAFPSLHNHKILIALIFIWLLTLLNLRGITESATIFSLPTYIFIGSILLLLVTGIVKFSMYGRPPMPVMPATALPSGISLFLILRAFSAGCTALTGVEAISNGVPAFKHPESKNAAITLVTMAGIIVVLFGGITFLANVNHIIPSPTETVVSQIAATVFGRNFFYYLIQVSTAIILFLAANTSFAGFPLLTSILAQDGFLPRRLSMRGDRLVYSNGIITLAALASLLVIIFKGEVHALIPLYAVGVFLSFTLSQGGMVKRWIRQKHSGWRLHAFINGTGTVVTGIVLIVIAITKFTSGAWTVIVLIPCLVLLFRKIRVHYQIMTQELAYHGEPLEKTTRQKIIIPIASLTRVVAHTIDYARTFSPDIVAVHVAVDEEKAEKLKMKWAELEPDIPLVVLPSPYRALLTPMLNFINEYEAQTGPGELITVLVPEFVTRKWWQYFLHNQTGLHLKAVLLLRKDIVVASVPIHIPH